MDEQESTALDIFRTLGVEIVMDPPVKAEGAGHTMCAYHAFVGDEEVDGGSASALLGWHTDGHFTATRLVRVVK